MKRYPQIKRVYLCLFLFIKAVHGSSFLGPCTNALIRELKELEPRPDSQEALRASQEDVFC